MIKTTEQALIEYLSGQSELDTFKQISKDNRDTLAFVQRLVKDLFAGEIARELLQEPRRYIPERLQRVLEEYQLATNNTSDNNTSEIESVPELNTDKAKALLKRAISAGVVKVENGRYEWKGTKVLLAYFVVKATEYLSLKTREFDKDDGTKKGSVSWKPFETLFGMSGLRNSKANYQDFVFEPSGSDEIDALFEDNQSL